MLVNRNLDHRRADYAYQRIKGISALEINNKDEIEKNYHSAVRSSSVLIQKTGLIQTLSFYISKKKDTQDENGQNWGKKSNIHYEFLAKHILNWILFYDTSSKFMDYDENTEPLTLYLSLLECTDEEIIQKTKESKALMLWLKRFADTMLKSGE